MGLVEDADKKQRTADNYRANFDEYRAMPRRPTSATTPGDTGRGHDSADYLPSNFHEVPVLVIPCLGAGCRLPPSAPGLGLDAPAVWSFMLALRERGLGSAWTTLHLINGGENEVAELLGIPFDKVTQAGLFPVAYTKGTDFKPAAAPGVENVLHWDSGSRAPRRGAARSARSTAERSAGRPRTRCGGPGRGARSPAPAGRSSVGDALAPQQRRRRRARASSSASSASAASAPIVCVAPRSAMPSSS